MKDETLAYEKYRVILAKELRVAPDDIDLSSILRSVFRTIRENCENDPGEYILTIKGDAEVEAILGAHGQKIIHKILEI